MALKFAILGLLCDQPMHGYALKKALAPALGRDRLPNDGILYPLLAALESDGLVKKRRQTSDAGRRRNVFSITDAGNDALLAWLTSDADEADEVTYDFFVGKPFLTKCLFFKHLPADEVAHKLDAQRAATKHKLALFRRIRDTLVERDVDHYRLAIVDLGIAQTRAKLRWLAALIKHHEQRNAA